MQFSRTFCIFHNFARITECYCYYWGLLLSLIADIIIYTSMLILSNLSTMCYFRRSSEKILKLLI